MLSLTPFVERTDAKLEVRAFFVFYVSIASAMINLVESYNNVLVTVTYGDRWGLLIRALHSAKTEGFDRAVVVRPHRVHMHECDAGVRADRFAYRLRGHRWKPGHDPSIRPDRSFIERRIRLDVY